MKRCEKTRAAFGTPYSKAARIFFLVLLSFTVHVAQAQEDYALTGVKFVGNQSLSESRLLALMTTRATPKAEKIFFWMKPPRYSTNLLQRDLTRLITFYQTEGFLNAKIDTVILKTDEKHKSVALTIKIAEGQPVIVRHVRYQFLADHAGDGEAARAPFEAIRPKMTLREGHRYRDQALQTDREMMIRAFNDAGYPYMQVHPEPHLERTANAVDITFNLDTGPQCFFGEVEVIGNQHTPASIIQKQLAFQRGQLFSQELIQKSQRQVYLLGFFQFVTIKLLLGEQRSKFLPVQVLVKEASRLTMKFGVGYGTEDDFRAFIDLRRLGVFGGARRLSVFVKHSGLEPYNINAKLTQPSFITPKTSLTLNPFYRQEKEPGFTVTRVGGNLTVQQRVATYTDGYLNYTLEQDNLNVSKTTREQALDSSAVKLYNKSSVTMGLVRDNSGPLFYQTKGMFTALTFTLSGIGFKSDFHFARLVLEARRYKAKFRN
jgi:outer membrane protein insertion porin family